MSYPYPAKFQVAKDLSTNASLTTSPAWFTGDFQLLSVSCSTQSNTGLIIQQADADGFQSVIPEAAWFTVLTVTGLGSTTSIYDLPIGRRWSRSSSQANSNATIIFAGRT